MNISYERLLRLALALANIPSVEFCADVMGERMECSVCKEEFSEGDTVKQLVCEHLFHAGCIGPWVESHCTCPLCRRSLCQYHE